MTYTVYMHISPSGKRYIGITCQNVNQRYKKGDGYNQCPRFWGAIQKYGWDSFRHLIIAGNLSKEVVCKLEVDLISHYDTTNPEKGYNIATGGEVNSGYHLREETRKKLSETRKNKFAGENHPFYGKHLSEEHKQKISEAHKGENHWFYGKRHSEETRKKMREAWKNRPPMSEEIKRKISESKKGKPSPLKSIPKSEEHKRKQSEIMKGRIPPNRKPVQCIETGVIYSSIKEAEKQTEINYACISGVCNGRHKTAGGYHWKFKE